MRREDNGLNEAAPPPALQRGLKNRHIQLIALGGAIGTGLFLGVAETIQTAGPAVLAGYALAGLLAFFIMRQLGEMVAEEPVCGSFSYFAHRYWHPFAGFAAGWNYWTLYVLVGMAELSAVGLYMHFWWPQIPVWVSAAVCFVLINAVNCLQVKVFGEVEFWFAIVKVAAIVGMMVFGAILLISGQAGPDASVSNLWRFGGFFPHGVTGLTMAMAVILFSFGGLELVGMTAAEAENPRYTIPRATNQVVVRILVFYIGALTVLLSLYPWTQVVAGSSPFVMIFSALHVPALADGLNVIVLSAALSVYNSCVYANSRMLLGLALQGDAPKALARVNQRGLPVAALAVSGLATLCCIALNYWLPGRAFSLLMSLVVTALLINWTMITITHWQFRRIKARRGEVTFFPAIAYPWSNALCLLAMGSVLVLVWMTPQTRVSVSLIPVWLGLLALAWYLRSLRLKRSAARDAVTD